jgi:hypothetical protein
MRDTIDIAREAGIRSPDNYKLTVSHMSVDTLKAFEALVRADEREACAKVCENWTQTPETTGMELALCATAIRNRGNT